MHEALGLGSSIIKPGMVMRVTAEFEITLDCLMLWPGLDYMGPWLGGKDGGGKDVWMDRQRGR